MENMEKKDAGLPAGKKKRKIPWSMLYILATVVAVLLFGLFNQQFGNVFHTISNLTPGFLSLGVLISLVYFLFEGEIFRLLLRSQGYRISVPYIIRKTYLGPLIFEERKEENPCSLCARMRRGILHNICVEEGISKLALGHHFDDAVQTFFMNLFYGGKIGCFSPKTYLSRKKITVIRPLVFCEEREITGAARRLALPIVKSACPADGVTARKDTADLVKQLEKQFPHLRTKVLGAMQRANLDGWGDTTS